MEDLECFEIKTMLCATSSDYQLGAEIPSPPVVHNSPGDPQPLLNSIDKEKVEQQHQKTRHIRNQKPLSHVLLWKNSRDNSSNIYRSRSSSSSSSSGNPVAERKILAAGFYKKVDAVWRMLNGPEVTVNEISKMNGFRRVEQIILEAKKSSLLNRGNVDLLTTYLSTLGILDQCVDLSLNSTHIGEFGSILCQILNSKNLDYLIKKEKLNSIVKFFFSSSDRPDDQFMSIFETISQTSIGCEILMQEKSDFLEFLWNSSVQNTNNEIKLGFAVTIFTNFALFNGKRFSDFVIENKVLDILSQKSYEDPAIRHYIYLLLSILICQNHLNFSNLESFTTSLCCYLEESQFQELFERDYEEKFSKIGESIKYFCELIEKAADLNLTNIPNLIKTHCCIVRHHTNSMHDTRDLFKKYKSLIGNLDRDPNSEKQVVDIPVFQWSCDEVCKWLNEVGFENYEHIFKGHQIDGDLLLSMNQYFLEKEFAMTSSFDRMRYIRELESLMIATDYTIIDHSALDMWLINIDPQLSVYTYCMVKKGLDRKTVPLLNETLLIKTFDVRNPIHRRKILKSIHQQQQNDFSTNRLFL